MTDILEFPTRAQREEVYRLTRQALRDGTLVRPTICDWCGQGGPIHGHHPDYARPLMVVWLCGPCHRDHHLEYAIEREIYNWFHRTTGAS